MSKNLWIVSIEKYEIIKKDGKSHIKVQGINTSKEWINDLAKLFVEGKTKEISTKLGIVL